ncbi:MULTISPECIES: host cell division inhibitory peptide Kil [Raoultella]|uniref:host cell division inhibitory peptide Kil n=1 Tax=Raoultella TaxID=160674 RepID=UPI00096A777B|nr:MULTISPECIES: host cell division inhibitory peptide Kil [Raoultella]ULI44899.1 host cell division inhibitory peptide Kil [Raoultella ornithinolytica]HDX8325353.1 host cell division inhibitory peptide Kil [Raoultella ornithinolytica]HDX8337144.1 host cell division inhibitory peptide Kil [Raoultella ornithinolytica]
MVSANLLSAQNKLVIAQAVGDSVMWAQAMASMKHEYDSVKQTEDRMISGHINLLSSLKVDDVICNYEIYGDLTIIDGDLLLAQSKINTDIFY